MHVAFFILGLEQLFAQQEVFNMAEFCSECSLFDEFDHDLFKIAINLKPGYSENFVCEGCDTRGVYKDDSGSIYLAKDIEGEIKLVPVTVESLMT